MEQPRRWFGATKSLFKRQLLLGKNLSRKRRSQEPGVRSQQIGNKDQKEGDKPLMREPEGRLGDSAEVQEAAVLAGLGREESWANGCSPMAIRIRTGNFREKNSRVSLILGSISWTRIKPESSTAKLLGSGSARSWDRRQRMRPEGGAAARGVLSVEVFSPRQ